MPIDSSWRSMLEGIRKSYCKGDSKVVTRQFKDGSSISMCEKAWSVFFATMNKKGWDETKSASNLDLAVNEILMRR